MDDNQLEQLLMEADAAAPPPGQYQGLAGQVQRRARRRSVVRVGAGSAVLLLAAGIIVNHAGHVPSRVAKADPHQTPTSRQLPSIDPAQLKAEIAQLAAEADIHARTAAAIIEGETRASRRRAEASRRARLWEQLARPDAVQMVMAQRERAAQTLITFGDACLRIPSAKERAAAEDSYRRAIALAGEGPRAQEARQRLERMGA